MQVPASPVWIFGVFPLNPINYKLLLQDHHFMYFNHLKGAEI